jgi:RNA polymerase sporulation-specific sigma factor
MHRAPRSIPAALDRRTDIELVALSQRGCDDALAALIERYRRFVRAKARGYFLVGADRDDVEQEALIGLFKAARDFRPEHNASFRAFAELCITRQVITAIKAATRQKHQALNQYVSISPRVADDAAPRNVEELVHRHLPEHDPADSVIAAERYGAMRRRLSDALSPFEVDVLALHVDGCTYQEIADRLDRHTKAVDNALQRIKRKLELALEDRADDDRRAELELIAS